MKSNATKVLISLVSGGSTEIAADRITFEDGVVLIWTDGIETARYKAEDVTAVEFGIRAAGFSIDEVRTAHRNAYSKWTADEDALLLDLARKATSVADIAALFGRQESAIESRMAKLSTQLLIGGQLP